MSKLTVLPLSSSFYYGSNTLIPTQLLCKNPGLVSDSPSLYFLHHPLHPCAHIQSLPQISPYSPSPLAPLWPQQLLHLALAPTATCFKSSEALAASEYMNFSHGPGTPPSPVRTQVALPLSLQITVRVQQAPVPAVSFRLPEHLKHLRACGLQVMQLFPLLCLPHSSPTAASTSFTSLLNCHRHRQPSPDTS